MRGAQLLRWLSTPELRGKSRSEEMTHALAGAARSSNGVVCSSWHIHDFTYAQWAIAMRGERPLYTRKRSLHWPLSERRLWVVNGLSKATSGVSYDMWSG